MKLNGSKMYRIDRFLEYYNRLGSTQAEITKGVWVNAQPCPFYYGILTIGYWQEKRQKLKDAIAVFKGKAVAVT